MRKTTALWCVFLIAAMVDASPKIVCYYPNWAYYKPNGAKFTVDHLDVKLCTHVVYAFAVFDPVTFAIKPQDPLLDINMGNYAKAVALKQKNPNLKVLISVGGWNDTQDGRFSLMASSGASMASFADSALTFMQTYGFDGLDLHWQFPTLIDKAHFALLVTALRTKLGAQFQLTIAAAASPALLDRAYDIPKLSALVDAIHLLTYDMYTETKADSHAPLYKRPWEIDDNSVDYSVNYWIQKGALPSKLVLGIPTYGRSWKLASVSAVAPPNALATGVGYAAPGTGEPGTLGFWEICQKIKAGGWTVVQDPNVGTYAYSVDTSEWVGYDDVAMVTKRANYAKSKSLGGATVWHAAMDDFNGVCGFGKNPLTTAIFNALNSGTVLATTEETPSVVVTTTKRPPTSFVCPSNGLHACPTDCSKFYTCVDGAASLHSCGQGSLFNNVKKICDLSSNVVCP